MKEHRIISAGNSAAVTLSVDELNHLGVIKSDLVIIEKLKSGGLRIMPAPVQRKAKRMNYRFK